jgi:1,4-dihydroxy-6-naphthoate synthase
MPLSPTLSIAHSPDPDDAFMFYGLSQRKIPLGDFRLKHVLKDIQSLNRDAARGKYDITAISTAAYPSVSHHYWILSVGSSVGRKYGPRIVTLPKRRKLLSQKKWAGLRIATPGPQTTAFLLLRLYQPDIIPVHVPFDKVFEAVRQNKADAGVIIHEGQLTYKQKGFISLVDLGAWWYRQTHLPIPLGLDVIKKSLGRRRARQLAKALYQSIELAYRDKKNAVSYAMKFGRGINSRVGSRFVQMYVNQDTLDMGPEGEKAIKTLFDRAYQAKLFSRKPSIHIIRP